MKSREFGFLDLMFICLLGCVLPVLGYALAMGILFGFAGIGSRRQAAVLLIIPTLYSLVQGTVGWYHRIGPAVTGLVLAVQLALAVIVAGVIALIINKRRRKREVI
jgi:hypothetical protein